MHGSRVRPLMDIRGSGFKFVSSLCNGVTELVVSVTNSKKIWKTGFYFCLHLYRCTKRVPCCTNPEKSQKSALTGGNRGNREFGRFQEFTEGNEEITEFRDGENGEFFMGFELPMYRWTNRVRCWTSSRKASNPKLQHPKKFQVPSIKQSIHYISFFFLRGIGPY
jgi:hypothetical protein